ncbi:F0F1 ATP synthase subunit gamma [Desulfallas sp. Bu1-1]|jgi:F-type H+-transporting ATPase subunit gamma|uniref:ATP synthase F1 subunit gamma n=1 Tax=Desulfallas sp. Bu1-1 TaxID=2787620 RepID=UPI00189C9845|nr:ATP synthase F1 subunit gamma [Desulfallas sp. Bu1-1]MBF7081551.1 F0F1 ATP synthase subunit gamma [Desulfallas sp. Bu1-1]
MASLRDLRRRIKSIKSTQQITKAMKAVSAAKMRRAQESVLAARPFARRMRDVLGRVGSASVGLKHPLLAVREPNRVAYVIVTADRGLCGGFNANIIKKAVQEMKDRPNVEVVTIGRKGRDYFRRRGYNIAQQYVGIGETADIGLARRVAKFVMDKYAAEEYDEVYLIYSQFVNVLVQKPVVQKLLPVEPPEGEDDGKRVDYIFEPDAEQIMGRLLPMYVENAMFQALLESKAGEHSARMTAMDNATSNAADMIDRLTLSMNRARQAAITKEISEIVGGAAALE